MPQRPPRLPTRGEETALDSRALKPERRQRESIAEFFNRKKVEATRNPGAQREPGGAVVHYGSFTNVLWPRAWSERYRCLPNSLIRSAVFCARDAGTVGLREVHVDTIIRAQGGIEIRKCGEQLDYADLKTFAAIVHLARRGRSRYLSTRMSELLKVQGMSDAGANRQRTLERLERLSKTTLKITVATPAVRFDGPLLQSFQVHPSSKMLEVAFAPGIDELFKLNTYTLVQWKVWRRLNRKPIASWLYFFMHSHVTPHALKTETILELCGSKAQSVHEFEKDLRRALLELESALQEEVGQQLTWTMGAGKLSKFRIASKAEHATGL